MDLAARTPHGPTACSQDAERRAPTRRRGLRLATAGALLAGGAVVAPASASVVSMASGHSITTIHNIDMIVVTTPSTTDIGKTATVQVTRAGTPVARAQGPLVAGAEGGAALEVNHGVDEGAPAPGDCWESSTTNDVVQVGDHVTFSVDGTPKGEVVVDRITLGAATLNGDEVYVPLTITKQDGTPPTGVDGGYRDDDVPGKFRAEAAVRQLTPNTFQLVYTAPLYGQETQAVPSATARDTLLHGTHHTAMFGHDDAAQESQIVEGLTAVHGPADGCPPLGGGGGTPIDGQAPSAPPSLTATATSTTQIRLNWAAASDNVGVTGYRISRVGSAETDEVGATARSFTATGLTPGTAYTFEVRALDRAGNVSPPATARATTQTASPTGRLTISDVRASEGDPTRTTTHKDFVFRVTLSAASTGPVTVRYATAPGTAKSPSDYVTKSGTLTIPAGSTSRTVAVAVVRDNRKERHETFTLRLSTPTGAAIADAVGIARIMNDD